MMRLKRNLIFLIILTIFFTLSGFKPVDAVTKPKIQLVVQPKSEYKIGDTITLTFKSPNYKGKVQYRAYLYNVNTKKSIEVWYLPKTGYYYTQITPSGLTNFKINEIIQDIEPGTYNITVLSRRLGSNVAYDSLVKTKNFTIIKRKLSVEEVAKFNTAVLWLKVYDIKNNLIKTGSGFVVSSYGRVVTNFHVIDKASSVKAFSADGKEYDVTGVLNFNKDQDIAVLYIKDYGKLSYVSLGDSSKVNLGQDIVAIGSPLDFQNTVSTGIISSIRSSIYRTADGCNDIQISAPISHGSSGGALFDLYADVIGITYAGNSNGENLNFAIPINEVKPMLQSNTYKTFEYLLAENHKQISTDEYSKASTYIYQNYNNVIVNDYYIEVKNMYVYSKNENNEKLTLVVLDTENYNWFKKAMLYNYDNGKKDVEEWLNYISISAATETAEEDVLPKSVGTRTALFYYDEVDQCPIGFSGNEVKYDDTTQKWKITKLLVDSNQDYTGKYNFIWKE